MHFPVVRSCISQLYTVNDSCYYEWNQICISNFGAVARDLLFLFKLILFLDSFKLFRVVYILASFVFDHMTHRN
jgi:hypothetical protein